jgi:hypothetical protein
VGAGAQRKKEVEHPVVGRLVLEQTAYQLADAPELKLVLYTPLDAATDSKLRQLHAEVAANSLTTKIATQLEQAKR